MEAWTSYEVRMPLDDPASPGPHWMKLANDLRYGANYPGIGQVLVRLGPVWEVSPFLTVATHVSTNAERKSPEQFAQEIRLELEPTLRWSWGDVRVNDRVRLERRFLFDESRWRLRNRLQFSYQAPSWAWVPFVSEEAFWEDGAYDQNRFSLGASLPSGQNARIALGYLLRSKEEGGQWSQMHALTFGFTFSPVIAPLFDDGPSR